MAEMAVKGKGGVRDQTPMANRSRSANNDMMSPHFASQVLEIRANSSLVTAPTAPGLAPGSGAAATFWNVDKHPAAAHMSLMDWLFTRWLRARQAGFSLGLVLAMLLPLLLGAIPAPALSAEGQIASDIASSRCSPTAGDGGPRHDPATHDCCILCAGLGQGTAAPPLKGGIDAMLPDVVATLHYAAPPLPSAAAVPGFDHIAPRGPPAA